MFNRLQPERLLFIWDGTRRSIAIADQVLASRKKMLITCLHVLPHESICAYSTAGHFDLGPRRLEQRIISRFDKSVSTSKYFRGRKLEIVFGDRINEILRYTEITKAGLLLMPKFEQSMFSSWIHGDLNRRVIEKANCEVLLYDSESETWSGDSKPAKQDESNN